MRQTTTRTLRILAIADQEYAIASLDQLVITLDPGVYDYTATDPRFDPYDSVCEVEADAVYRWYSDDSDWGSCDLIWSANESVSYTHLTLPTSDLV